MKKAFSPLNYALYLLKKRDRTVGSIRQKMALKGFEEQKINETIDFLVEKKFLDDERYAKNFVIQKRQIRQEGKYLIRQKLKAQHLTNSIIEGALNKIDSQSEKLLAEESAQKWFAKSNHNGNKDTRLKLGQYLMRRGFEYEVVKEILENIKN